MPSTGHSLVTLLTHDPAFNQPVLSSEPLNAFSILLIASSFLFSIVSSQEGPLVNSAKGMGSCQLPAPTAVDFEAFWAERSI